MAVSITDLITRVRAALDERPYVSTGTLTSAGDLICTVTDGTAWDTGAIIEFYANGGEQCLVESVSGNDLTVKRGWNGTTAVTQTSQPIFRDPVFTYKAISDALQQAVNELWPHAWKPVADTVTPDTSAPIQTWYDLAAGALGLISVEQSYGTSDLKAGYFGEGRTQRQVVFKRDLPTALAASGVGVSFPGGFFHASNVVSITYAAAITGSSDIEDDGELNVASVVVDGALARLLVDKEAMRVAVGEDLEVSRSVRVGGRMSVAAFYERKYQRGKELLRVKHQQQFPLMPTRKVK